MLRLTLAQDQLRALKGSPVRRIVPDMYWDCKARRWKRALEFADVPRHLLAANNRPRSETTEIVYGNIDEVTEGIRERSGNFDLTTSDVLEFFSKHPRPPRQRDFENREVK